MLAVAALPAARRTSESESESMSAASMFRDSKSCCPLPASAAARSTGDVPVNLKAEVEAQLRVTLLTKCKSMPEAVYLLGMLGFDADIGTNPSVDDSEDSEAEAAAVAALMARDRERNPELYKAMDAEKQWSARDF